MAYLARANSPPHLDGRRGSLSRTPPAPGSGSNSGSSPSLLASRRGPRLDDRLHYSQSLREPYHPPPPASGSASASTTSSIGKPAVYRLLQSPNTRDYGLDRARNFAGYDQSAERQQPRPSSSNHNYNHNHNHNRHNEEDNDDEDDDNNDDSMETEQFEQNGGRLGPIEAIAPHHEHPHSHQHSQQPHQQHQQQHQQQQHSHSDLGPPDSFDYTMRRHSIAVPQHPDPHRHHHNNNNHHHHPEPGGVVPAGDNNPRSSFNTLPSGSLKHKISHNSFAFGTPPIEEYSAASASANASAAAAAAANATYRPSIDSMDGPGPKRRGSAFDQRSLAQMSLNDRRDSVDSGRYPAQQPPIAGWWDRRDSSASIYSNPSVSSIGSYNTSYSGDSKATWHATTNPSPNSASRPYSSVGLHPTTTTTGSNVPYPDRRMSVPDASMAAAAAANRFRSHSRPPSRGAMGSSSASITPPSQEQHHYNNPDPHHQQHHHAMAQSMGMVQPITNPSVLAVKESTPYSRSPELRISHKLAERKRRKEMKDLFDELRDNLPTDRGMKASKWEILSKSIEYISQLRNTQHEMAREIEQLRAELTARGGTLPPSSTATTANTSSSQQSSGGGGSTFGAYQSFSNGPASNPTGSNISPARPGGGGGGGPQGPFGGNSAANGDMV